MRDMVLNPASLSAPARNVALDWLRGMAVGMSDLVRKDIASNALKSSAVYADPVIRGLNGWTLSTAILALRPIDSDMYVFLMDKMDKLKLLDESVLAKVEFRSCEERALTEMEGQPLLDCAIHNGIAIGFPSEPEWDRDCLNVKFIELRDDAEISEAWEEVDNLTRSDHVTPVCERHRAMLQHLANFAELWENRAIAFPHLIFGPDVKEHFEALDNPGPVVKTLASLNETAKQWRINEKPAPQWGCKVTNESESVRNSPKLRGARYFRSDRSPKELFAWHARFGHSGRIHFRLDFDLREIEIGYIGRHLPL